MSLLCGVAPAHQGRRCQLWALVSCLLSLPNTELTAHGCGRRPTPHAAGAWYNTLQALVTAKVNVITL